MEYESMLTDLYKKMPEKTLSKERFELPLVNSMIQGSKTIVHNFDKILKAIRRDEDSILKYLTKELATAATMSEGKLILKGKFTSEQLQRVIADYTNRNVLCKECKRPDTKVVENKGVKMLKCEACGAVSPAA
jgi:translation initiation factor 2 subunit 2